MTTANDGKKERGDIVSTKSKVTTAAIATAVAASALVATASTADGAAATPSAAARVTTTSGASSAHGDLIHPQHVAIAGLSKQRAALALLRVRELYTFWDTGDVRYLHRADSPAFVDHTLPAGRPQGRGGIELASRTFRAAVPDLHCTVADVEITGNRASVRQIYSGHFTGTYNGIAGKGQTVRFIAFDIQQLGKQQIVGDWHLEDNLTFMKQIGAVK